MVGDKIGAPLVEGAMSWLDRQAGAWPAFDRLQEAAPSEFAAQERSSSGSDVVKIEQIVA